MRTVKAPKVPNYTDEQVQTIVTMYAELGNAGVEAIAEAVGKTPRSVMGKLQREGVWLAAGPRAKAPKVEGPSKKDLLAELVRVTGLDESLVFNGLAGARKDAVEALIGFFDKSEAA